MGARSFIVRGKGNPESFQSCSHGAGRAMSRNEAKRRFTVEDHMRMTEGVECRKDEDVIDETPAAYKPIIPAGGNFGEVSGLHLARVGVFESSKCPLSAGSAAVDRKRDGVAIDTMVSWRLKTANAVSPELPWTNTRRVETC